MTDSPEKEISPYYLAARQAGKSELIKRMLEMEIKSTLASVDLGEMEETVFYRYQLQHGSPQFTKISRRDFIILDEWGSVFNWTEHPQDRDKPDWKHPIPISGREHSPDEKTRAKLRAKRKKRK